ncbi:MAG: hypothetical protein ACK443_01515 [Methylococcaceae bacterium]
MDNSLSKLVVTGLVSHEKPATRSHTQFRNLIRKIDKQKALLAVWLDTEPVYQNKISQSYLPLITKLNQHKAEMIHLFDKATENPLFKKRDREKLADLIRSLSYELIQSYGMDELKPVYDRCNDISFDQAAADDARLASEAMKSMMSSVLNLNLEDEEGLDSPEKLSEHINKLLDERERANQEAREKRAQRRPKTAKQQEKAEREEAEARHVSKALQDIYRKLVTVMHPDREPDSAERERKTELMQRVNVAYENNDLLQLLELQLALEQIDPEHLASMAEERIKRYNKILRAQSSQMAAEIEAIERRMRRQLQLPPYRPIRPEMPLHRLNEDIAIVKREIADAEGSLQALKDPATLKAWLKDYKIPRAEKNDLPLFDPWLDF